MNNKINNKINELALLILESQGEQVDFSDEDLENAVVIWTNVMLSKTYDKHKDQLDPEGIILLAQELGHSIQQTVELFTGVDLREAKDSNK